MEALEGKIDALGLGSAAVQTLLDAPLPCVAVGPDGRLRALNLAAKRLAPTAAVGQPVQAALGKDLDHLLAAAAVENHCAVAVVADDGSGTFAPLLAQPLRLTDGGALLMLSDLAALQTAEEARLERTPYGIARLDQRGAIRFANSALRALWSNRGALIGEEFASLFPDQVASDLRSRLREVLASEFARTVRVTEGFYVTDGEHRFRSEPQLTLVPYFAPDGRVVGVIAHIHERIMDALRLAVREAAADDVRDAPCTGWRDRMCAILDLLQLAVPHDRAVLSVLSKDRAWARPILVHPPVDWPRAWARVPPDLQERMAKEPFPLELPERLQSDPELGEDPMVARHAADGMASHAVLPVPYGQPEAVLTLAAKRPGHFGPDEDDAVKVWSDAEDAWPQAPFRALLSLRLEPLLMAMLRRAERQEEEALRAMAEGVSTALTMPDATHALLSSMVAQFQWDHAAVFAVEPGANGGQFRLFAQYPEVRSDGTPHPLALPAGYTQPLYLPPKGAPFDLARARASGMLGAAVRAGAPLVAADTSQRDTRGDAPHFFQSVARESRSALTVPITLDGRTRWVLDTISRQENAFHEEDGERVGPLVRRLAREVVNRRNVLLNELLIERIEEGVVVTDAVGTLLRANARARQMLGLPQSGDLPDGRRLSDHAADAATREWLAGTETAGSIRLGPTGGLGSEVRVRRHQDQTETRDLIWLLDGADEQDWTYDRTYIEATVQEVARQVRGPLLLASSLAGRLARTVHDGAAPAIERVRAEIGKADITFERLAEAIGTRRDPKRSTDRVEISTLLAELIAALPEQDRTRLKRCDSGANLAVYGDRERLRFVLRTLLGHLLACTPDQIDIGAEPEGAGPEARLRLRLATSDVSSAEPGVSGTPLEQAAQAAREAAALALDTIRDVLRAHGGAVSRKRDGFELELPLAPRSTAA